MLCPICSRRRHFLYIWQGFQVFRCEGCETESVAPEPTASELAAYYQSFSAAHTHRWPIRLKLVKRSFEGYLRSYRRFSGREKPARFLDAGGGVGYWVRAAVDRGIHACLLDCDSDALRFARDTLAISWVAQGDIQNCGDLMADGSFDLVLARHAVEHVPDPAGFIRNLARIVRPGGLLEIETPNVASREQFGHPGIIRVNCRLLRQANPAMSAATVLRHALAKSMSGVNPPKHLWGFTVRGLRLLLERSGFSVLRVTQAAAGDPVFDPLYYDVQKHSSSRPPGMMYSFWERASSVVFARQGTNLCILARREP